MEIPYYFGSDEMHIVRVANLLNLWQQEQGDRPGTTEISESIKNSSEFWAFMFRRRTRGFWTAGGKSWRSGMAIDLGKAETVTSRNR